MDTFTVRDLREHTGQLIHDAEAGKLSLITKHGRPIFLAVPFDEDMLKLGLQQAMAVKLFQENTLTLQKSAKLAGISLEAFIEKLGTLGIAAVDYSPTELQEELKDFE
ncbi:MAG: prevent-host-death family protein [Gammaproteobacteria bacterium]|jgi:prevent-host-death family protein|nr:prevent-host-death family protein [Gammaproteobacteria bacterium]